MDTRAKWEIATVVVLALAVLVSLIPSLAHARRERRDGWRREQAYAIKQELEAYFNIHERYPTMYTAPEGFEYVVLATQEGGATQWYIRTALENVTAPEAAFDYEHNVFYQTVVDGSSTYFDICGGEYTCGVTRDH